MPLGFQELEGDQNPPNFYSHILVLLILSFIV